MIVLEVNVDGILAIKRERKSKVTGHGDRPTPFPIAPKRMQSPAGDIHILWTYSGIQPVQHSIDPRTMFFRNSTRSAAGEVPGDALVAEGADHSIAKCG